MALTKKFSCAILPFLLLGLAACDGGASDDPPAADPAGFDGEQFAVVGPEDAFANVESATLDRDASMLPVLDGSLRLRHPDRRPLLPGNHLRYVLRLLGLSEDQVEQIRQAIREHRMEVAALLEQLREVSQPILDAANAERREIAQRLQNGEITREEALRLLHELNERTRMAIRSNPLAASILQAICEARQGLFETIRQILSEAQQIEWDGWTGGNRTCS